MLMLHVCPLYALTKDGINQSEYFCMFKEIKLHLVRASILFLFLLFSIPLCSHYQLVL